MLAAVYAGLNYVAIRKGEEAQLRGPEWREEPGAMSDGMTFVAANAWGLTWRITLAAGVLGLAPVVAGVLLPVLRGRGRNGLLALVGVIAVLYALLFAVACLNRSSLFDSPDYGEGVPSWQPATPFILVAAGLAQSVGLVQLDRVSRGRSGPPGDYPPAPGPGGSAAPQ
ncbi:hypothetical protein ACFFMN_22710 [Planobispora siamensis]|uniref:hypothetical protein n=1 Tax=Planobispora siamensis TaxID=936338 RepID=UPI0035E48325